MPDKLMLAKNSYDVADNINNYQAAPLAETLTNGFFTVDATWIVLYWNRAAEVILGVKAKDIVGKDLWTKFAGVIPKELFTIDQRAFQKDVPVHFHEYWGEMGAWFDVITYHCDNTLSVSFKSSKHIHTAYNQNPVQRLNALTELYRFVTEITNDCLWEWDLHAKDIFWIDGGHKRVFGYQVENALIPQSFWEQCIHPDDKASVLTALQQIVTTGTSSFWEAEYRFKTADENYLYVHDRGHIIYDDAGKASRIIGATQNISEKVLLENKLTQERLAKQHEITDAVLKSQEKERQTIATELNENLNQLLVAAKWNVQIAKTDEAKRDDCLNNSVEYLNNVIADIKRMYKTLVIPDNHIVSLFDNIKTLIADTYFKNAITCTFDDGGIYEEELSQNMQIDILRIVQEQMKNIIAHAGAVHASINLSRHKNKIILVVADNGDGCDMHTEKTGIGIINIRSRAELYDGNISITSKPGKGYALKVVLPCFPHYL